MFFKPVTTLKRIEQEIYANEKALIENQGTAEHYQHLADANKSALTRLRKMRQSILDEQKPVVAIAPEVKVEKAERPAKPQLRSAS